MIISGFKVSSTIGRKNNIAVNWHILIEAYMTYSFLWTNSTYHYWWPYLDSPEISLMHYAFIHKANELYLRYHTWSLYSNQSIYFKLNMSIKYAPPAKKQSIIYHSDVTWARKVHLIISKCNLFLHIHWSIGTSTLIKVIIP